MQPALRQPDRGRTSLSIGLVCIVLLCTLVALSAYGATQRRVSIGNGMVVALDSDQEIFLEAPPLEGEGLWAFSRRLTGGTRALGEIRKNNRNTRRLLAGVRYRIPYDVLTGEHQVRAFRGLFPDDAPTAQGWTHTVSTSGDGYSLWHLAFWLTGEGKHFTELRDYNQLADNTLRAEQKLRIPAAKLRPAFRALLPPPEPVVVAQTELPDGVSYERVASGEDTAGSDGGEKDGNFLVYPLKKGEALYSSVVVRFTGAAFAEDVNKLAAEIAELNKIPDVTDIRIGHPIKVPFDLLLPEYLPSDNPRRQEWETNRTASAQYSNTVRTSTLEGITIILDSGHGGQDPGATNSNVREGIYVYDIMLRVKRLLESKTAAQVITTTRDGSRENIVDRDVLPNSNGHRVLTDPPYAIRDTTVGTHLRWYLANSLHRAAVKRTRDPAKTLFISLHADSLHSSLRGAMVYIPAVSLTSGRYGKSGSPYSQFAQVREEPRVEYSWSERVRSEGLSRQLANKVLDSFRKRKLAVHKEKPIRDRIIRCRRCRPFVPAVVRYNAVPAKMLFEVCNLNNTKDRKLLTTRAFRQETAEALVDGIIAYYGENGP